MAAKGAEQEIWERSEGYVYFVAAGDPPVVVKIGITTAPRLGNRVREHQGSNHEPLRLLGAIPFRDSERPMADAQAREQSLHRQFADLQRFEAGWAGSEWFTATPGLLAFIESVAKSPAELRAPESEAKPGPGLTVRPK